MDDFPDAGPPFQCTPADCPQGACKLAFFFAPSCQNQLSEAEVLIDGYLEPGTATFGTTYRGVGDVPVGKTVSVYVRSDRWEIPLDFNCGDLVNGVLPTPLSCCTQADIALSKAGCGGGSPPK